MVFVMADNFNLIIFETFKWFVLRMVRTVVLSNKLEITLQASSLNIYSLYSMELR